MLKFTETIQDDIMYSNDFEEDYGMLARYHNSNSIYLYKYIPVNEAATITEKNNVSLPITLYETVETAKLEAKDLKNPICLRFAVNIEYTNIKGNYAYDEFSAEITNFVKKYNIILEEYKKDCGYIRYASKLGSQKVIAYQINNLSRILNAQKI